MHSFMYLLYNLFATLTAETSSNRKTEQLGTFARFVQSCRYSKFMNS